MPHARCPLLFLQCRFCAVESQISLTMSVPNKTIPYRSAKCMNIRCSLCTKMTVELEKRRPLGLQPHPLDKPRSLRTLLSRFTFSWVWELLRLRHVLEPEDVWPPRRSLSCKEVGLRAATLWANELKRPHPSLSKTLLRIGWVGSYLVLELVLCGCCRLDSDADFPACIPLRVGRRQRSFHVVCIWRWIPRFFFDHVFLYRKLQVASAGARVETADGHSAPHLSQLIIFAS